MIKTIAFSFSLFLVLSACGQNSSKVTTEDNPTVVKIKIDTNGDKIVSRFPEPLGFKRTQTDSLSFANYLRNLPLKTDGAPVTYYNGKIKSNSYVHAAVVDLPIGTRDLHQCADAVMRLKAEYLFEQKEYDAIHFNFTNGFTADYATWRKGNRIAVNGNKVTWVKKASPSDSSASFWKYLEMVFSYAGTASLEKELDPISINKMEIGDVFIKGGFPGHAVIVADMAKNTSTGAKIFLLAQSYMPAQEIQVLNNPNNNKLSPWYSISEISLELQTPEWIFESNQLKRFKN